MNNAELYGECNNHTRTVTLELFNDNAHRIKWKGRGDRIVDIGCGDGGVTMDILRMFLPSNYEKLVGLDISESMVTHASKQHSDERTSFVVQDIAGVLQPSLRQSFDHAFSIYALHWVKDQERAFRNVYDMLTPGGDLLFSILIKTYVFEAYRVLKQNNKWATFLADAEKYISPYQDSKNPEEEVKIILERVGFKNIHLERAPKKFCFKNIDYLKKATKAVCPFIIPVDQIEDFVEDYLQVLRDLGYLRNASHPPDKEGYLLGKTVMTVYATKRAFRNVYEMLTPGGDLLFSILIKSYVFEAYRVLKQNNKWATILADAERYISPYQDSENPEEEVQMIMEGVGFKNIYVRCAPKKFVFKNIDYLKKTLKAVCPFEIPMGQIEDFLEDYLQVLRDLGYLRKASYPPDEKGYLGGITAMTVYATK